MGWTLYPNDVQTQENSTLNNEKGSRSVFDEPGCHYGITISENNALADGRMSTEPNELTLFHFGVLRGADDLFRVVFF